LFLLAAATAAVFVVGKLPLQLGAAFLIFCLPATARIARPLWLPALGGILPLIWLTLLFQGLWGPPPEEWGWSLPGLEQGGLISLRLLELALLAQLLALSTSPIALCDGLEKLLRPLGKVGFPHRDLALAFTIAWRFIPLLAQENQKLLKAQIARGAAWDEGSWRGRLMTLTGLLTPLLVRCFRYAEELALALEARGYGQVAHPTRLYPLQWKRLDTLVTVGMLTLVGVAIWLDRWA
jgi:energy-coupling factor transport system permease protein